jgi:hypothetical protein
MLMGGLRRGLLGVAVLIAVLAGSALPSGATPDRRISSVVATKGKKKPKKTLAACKLLTIAEITQALGTAPTEPPKSDSKDECDYSSPADYNFINLSLSSLVTETLWKRSVQGAGATIPVAGIGDEAFRSANNATIVVRKGKRTLRIDQYVPGLNETAVENLGKAATARL